MTSYFFDALHAVSIFAFLHCAFVQRSIPKILLLHNAKKVCYDADIESDFFFFSFFLSFLSSVLAQIDASLLFGAFVLGGIGLGSVLWIFPKIGLMDFPQRYGIARNPIPYPAGIAVISAFCISLLMFFDAEGEAVLPFFGFVGGLLLLGAVCFWDDRMQLSPVVRLGVQIICAGIVIATGTWIEFLTNPFAPEAFHLPLWLGAGITALWIVGFINTSNWLDGVPNLTLSSGVVASAVLGILSLSPAVGQKDLAMLCFLFCMVLLPFLLGNVLSQRFVLGDSGSMTIGYSLAVFSLFAGGKMATVLLVMSIPVFDGIFVFFARLGMKKSPLQGRDRLHLHETLLDRGWKTWQIFFLYFAVSVGLGVGVLFLGTQEKLFLIVSVFGMFVAVRMWMMISARR